MDRRHRIIELIRQVSQKDLTPEPGESLFDSGLIDSFALADLVSGLEREFGLKIPDSDLNPRKFDTVERIEQYLDSWA
jgi:acyl carrier protein